MKKLFVLIMLLNLHQMNAQDSLSSVFAKILNEYRIQNNLHPLIYDANLDSVAMVRLIESAHGIDDCFDDSGLGPVCKDGIRNQHFKFQKTMDLFNRHNDTMQILSENMVVIPEFTYDSRITGKKVTRPYLAETSLKSWIDSPKHNTNLLHQTATRFSFKIFRMKHSNLDWIHAVFLLVNEKKNN